MATLLPLEVPITLPGGEGEVSITAVGNLVFTPDVNFSGNANFNYTAVDFDGSSDVGLVQVTVIPTWNIAGDANATEGGNATYQIALNGALKPGETAAANLSLVEGSATLLD